MRGPGGHGARGLGASQVSEGPRAPQSIFHFPLPPSEGGTPASASRKFQTPELVKLLVQAGGSGSSEQWLSDPVGVSHVERELTVQMPRPCGSGVKPQGLSGLHVHPSSSRGALTFMERPQIAFEGRILWL